ncbi:hypothetical protein WOLCODRAFT_155301 [Wolfiporia cocos MD-104 SS10]|uniref:Uncharacterized protein n=1 Tax=Wolfiporia cocos (strain MD-104) TaxID=742152 RepID=A0A2H3J7E2_WOLCO|nr:hypothetical protein WOLCODRAFT_155301 [Wolfiporia cocos MD-104 SS10]
MGRLGRWQAPAHSTRHGFCRRMKSIGARAVSALKATRDGLAYATDAWSATGEDDHPGKRPTRVGKAIASVDAVRANGEHRRVTM